MVYRFTAPRPHPKHVATFRGSHNSAKSKVFIVLYAALSDQDPEATARGLTVQELHQLTGVKLVTIAGSVGKWHKYKYVRRRAKTNDQGKPVFSYRLDDRGKAFVETRIPAGKLKEYVKEIKAHRAKQKREGG